MCEAMVELMIAVVAFDRQQQYSTVSSQIFVEGNMEHFQWGERVVLWVCVPLCVPEQVAENGQNQMEICLVDDWWSLSARWATNSIWFADYHPGIGEFSFRKSYRKQHEQLITVNWSRKLGRCYRRHHKIVVPIVPFQVISTTSENLWHLAVLKTILRRVSFLKRKNAPTNFI